MWGRRFPPGRQSPGLGYPRHGYVFQPRSPLLEAQRSFWTPSSSFRPFFSHQVDSRGPPACQLLNTPTWIWVVRRAHEGNSPEARWVDVHAFTVMAGIPPLVKEIRPSQALPWGQKKKKEELMSPFKPKTLIPKPPGTERPDTVTSCGPLPATESVRELILGFCLGFHGVGGDEDVVKLPEAPFQDFWGQSSLGKSPKCRIWCLQ